MRMITTPFNGGTGGAQARGRRAGGFSSSSILRRVRLASGGIVNSFEAGDERSAAAPSRFPNEKLATNEYFARKQVRKGRSKQQQFGGTIGGPIVTGKANYFGSVERVLWTRRTTTARRAGLARTDCETTKVGTRSSVSNTS